MQANSRDAASLWDMVQAIHRITERNYLRSTASFARETFTFLAHSFLSARSHITTAATAHAIALIKSN